MKVQPVLKGRRIKFHILEGGISENLWIYAKTTTVKISGGEIL